MRLALLDDLRKVRRGWRWGDVRPATWAPAGGAIPDPEGDLGWARTEPVRTLRWLLQRGLSLPFTRLIANPRIDGREWLRQVDRPALLVSNHVSHADTPLLLYALTDEVREKTVVAAAADYWYRHPWLGRAISLWLNTFPFARTGSPQAVLSNSRRLLKSGWNLIVYAEGTRSPDGTMQPFKPGIGYLAVENRTPVIPMHIRGSQRIMSRGRAIPLPASAQVKIGKPIWPAQDENSRAFTRRIEDAVRDLGSRSTPDQVKGTWIERWRATAPTHRRS